VAGEPVVARWTAAAVQGCATGAGRSDQRMPVAVVSWRVAVPASDRGAVATEGAAEARADGLAASRLTASVLTSGHSSAAWACPGPPAAWRLTVGRPAAGVGAVAGAVPSSTGAKGSPTRGRHDTARCAVTGPAGGDGDAALPDSGDRGTVGPPGLGTEPKVVGLPNPRSPTSGRDPPTASAASLGTSTGTSTGISTGPVGSSGSGGVLAAVAVPRSGIGGGVPPTTGPDDWMSSAVRWIGGPIRGATRGRGAPVGSSVRATVGGWRTGPSGGNDVDRTAPDVAEAPGAAGPTGGVAGRLVPGAGAGVGLGPLWR
jgi:hypothetical protein